MRPLLPEQPHEGQTAYVLIPGALVAAKVPVAALVFVNAMIPRPGETPGAWWDNTRWADARVAAAEQGGYRTEFDLGVYFLHDVAPDVAATGEPSDSSRSASSRHSRGTGWASTRTSCPAAT